MIDGYDQHEPDKEHAAAFNRALIKKHQHDVSNSSFTVVDFMLLGGKWSRIQKSEKRNQVALPGLNYLM